MCLSSLNKMKCLLVQIVLLSCTLQLYAQTPGCTDDLATNFDPNATVNDGSCDYASASVSVTNSWLLPQVLNETSGLIQWNTKIWTHNDDTDTNLYEINSTDIDNYATYPLAQTDNVDWEEISQDDNYLYVGDFGNNANGNRTDLKILRVDKSSIVNTTPVIDTIAFSYSTQTDFTPKGANNTNYDCEAFIVSTDKIYLFTKEWISKTTTVYSLPKTPGSYIAEHVSDYDVSGLITGVTHLEDKRLVVLSGYSSTLEPFVFLLYDFQNADYFKGNKRKIILDLPFHQVEGITTTNGLDYFVSNERFSQSGITTEAQLHDVDLSGFLGDYLETLSSDFPGSENSESIRLYPNPGSEVINVKLNTSHLDHLRLVIYNHKGQKITDYSVASDSFQIDVSAYSAGIYYYSITGKTKSVFNGKFLVN